MLRIRLTRVGAKKQPSYRIVVADVESKRDGRIVERIGFYNPRVEPLEYDVAEDRALYWLSVGAQPSDAVRRLLVKQGTMDRLARLRQGEEMAALVAEFTGEAPEVAVSTEVATTEVADLEIEMAEEIVAEVISEVIEEAAIEEEE
ncbi:MAG TPA: 30S ribosomal protein S16 [Patescibacteria group bacterium]|nr:30S ribosomal protein S16 [Patescibacteria group bacterium]